MDVFDHYAMALRLAYRAGCATQDAIDDWCDIEEAATFEERVCDILTTVIAYLAEARRGMEVTAVALAELDEGCEELLAAMKEDGNGRDQDI